ncbi:hypothetical protein CO112_02875 [Candidatus Dojkabacteria bacterium CG_4_9_14_3_um_filter_150_Dojkabacteria_WS6_41_13]|uniref:Uncharacterized protein n=1 Tax=Candidatus Dojkabacteria bacterium CG_4_10_14_0_2_um_filter_Dojkabacteria_WS6_41_15 TaxID=2014249 RepID=A0A2M7W1C1_9BACT|nr:MAG: hypothetical protein COX64_03830 [Candidatus Dojkabacteria bacterium CG_4_10_14_0_2_um_filter_Dojkabacteria_WS6_41_15]PJB22730.1 MAG: hypothetical protein CO112_02875 [Candidatus Dojkabacteria bacterium CG_4_9_14_3_um_filter_150_Dojkabacteria_WS6_41_13]
MPRNFQPVIVEPTPFPSESKFVLAIEERVDGFLQTMLKEEEYVSVQTALCSSKGWVDTSNHFYKPKSNKGTDQPHRVREENVKALDGTLYACVTHAYVPEAQEDMELETSRVIPVAGQHGSVELVCRTYQDGDSDKNWSVSVSPYNGTHWSLEVMSNVDDSNSALRVVGQHEANEEFLKPFSTYLGISVGELKQLLHEQTNALKVIEKIREILFSETA